MKSAARKIKRAESLRGESILCFSHDWSSNPLGRNHIMRILAKENRVLWVNSIGWQTPSLRSKRHLSRIFAKLRQAMRPLVEAEKNLFVLSPLIVPIYGHPFFKRLNAAILLVQVKWAMRKLEITSPISWVCNPMAAMVVGKLHEKLIVYNCVDEYARFGGIQSSNMLATERGLVQQADLVVVSSRALLVSKSPGAREIVEVKHGVAFEHFSRALEDSLPLPSDVALLPKPILGYMGLLDPEMIDVKLVEAIARKYSQGSVVLIGHIKMDVTSLKKFPNVHFLGPRPYAELPAYCKAFDVGLIPFLTNELTRNANPLKVKEYLVAGLPVVSTPIPEVEMLGNCFIGKGPTEFLANINRALRERKSRRARNTAMRRESWEEKVLEIEGHLGRLILNRGIRK